ncbi:hypothetical protein CEXT_406061 [Caerostris extrusa]|uniref:Uncharacterized protein n=1 Tax=Caerostris extrusa TaxID=172846 RepID=A0AAV4NYV8_CAEEX|nr:hypothetical protein CEXT_406061 [Caerostris extrusa]
MVLKLETMRCYRPRKFGKMGLCWRSIKDFVISEVCSLRFLRRVTKRFLLHLNLGSPQMCDTSKPFCFLVQNRSLMITNGTCPMRNPQRKQLDGSLN